MEKTMEGTRPCSQCGSMIPRKWGESTSRYNRRNVCWLPTKDGRKQISPCERKAMGKKTRTEEQKAARKARYQETKLAENRKARADKWEPKAEDRPVEYVGAACSIRDVVGPDNIEAWKPATVRQLTKAEIRKLQGQYEPPFGKVKCYGTW